MQFGENNRAHKFYYGDKLETIVNQENHWKGATRREWKILGAKQQGYGAGVDTRKINQMQMFLHHRGASRSSSRVGSGLPKLSDQVGQTPPALPSHRSMQSGAQSQRSRFTDVTRATGWDSKAGSSASTVLLQELLASNLELKKEFGSLKNEMLRMQQGIANIEHQVPSTAKSGRRSRAGQGGDVLANVK